MHPTGPTCSPTSLLARTYSSLSSVTVGTSVLATQSSATLLVIDMRYFCLATFAALATASPQFPTELPAFSIRGTSKTVPPVPRSINFCSVRFRSFSMVQTTCGQGANWYQKRCIDDLVFAAKSQWCPTLETGCVCAQQNFLFGIRDCAWEACGAAVQSDVLKWYYGSVCN